MKDLVFKTQSACLEKNLDRIKKFEDLLEEKSQEIENLNEVCETIRTLISNLDDDIKKVIRNLKSSPAPGDTINTACDALSKIQLNDIKSIEQHLNKFGNAVASMRNRCALAPNRLPNLRQTAVGGMQQDATTLIADLKLTLESLQVRKEDDEEALEQRRKEAWKCYGENLYKRSRKLFFEYVDCLSGLAIRDAGLDGRVCELVDQLCDAVKGPYLRHGFAIPAREEALTMTVARVIRLGFPEWSIWALPLTAHEFGHVVIGANRYTYEPFLEKEGKEGTRHRNYLEEYLADAIATKIMGPAYAYAAVLLRFNPFFAYTSSDTNPPYDNRADVVSTVLQWTNEKIKNINIINELSQEWDDAVKQANPKNLLTKKDKNHLERCKEVIKNNRLDQAYIPYPSEEAWGRVLILTKEFNGLKENGEKVALIKENPEHLKNIGITITPDYDLRDVLNAAWQCRIAESEFTENLEIIARAYWDELIRQKYPQNLWPINVSPSRGQS